jgi:predicted nucleic acid-binding protein
LNIFADASVPVAALVDSGAEGAWVEEMLSSAALHAPELAKVEASNILRRLELAKRLTTAEVNEAFGDLLDLEIQSYAFDPLAQRMWELRHVVTSYDAWYIALAEALRLPLATLDRRLSRVQGVTCKFLVPRQA